MPKQPNLLKNENKFFNVIKFICCIINIILFCYYFLHDNDFLFLLACLHRKSKMKGDFMSTINPRPEHSNLNEKEILEKINKNLSSASKDLRNDSSVKAKELIQFYKDNGLNIFDELTNVSATCQKLIQSSKELNSTETSEIQKKIGKIFNIFILSGKDSSSDDCTDTFSRSIKSIRQANFQAQGIKHKESDKESDTEEFPLNPTGPVSKQSAPPVLRRELKGDEATAPVKASLKSEAITIEKIKKRFESYIDVDIQNTQDDEDWEEIQKMIETHRDLILSHLINDSEFDNLFKKVMSQIRNDLFSIYETQNAKSQWQTLQKIIGEIRHEVSVFKKLKAKARRLQSQSEIDIAGFFSLANTSAVGLSPADVPPNNVMALEFSIKSLQKFIKNFSHNPERERLQRLIQSYQTTLNFEKQQREMEKDLINGDLNLLQFNSKKKQLKNEILRVLEKEKEVFLIAGYSKPSSGHAVGLKLTMKGNQVCGQVSNRGEGSNYHGPIVVEGLKIGMNGILNLNETSIDRLKQSKFLDGVIELYFTNMPKENESGKFDFEFDRSTNFSIQDFYEGVIPIWPGNIQYSIGQTTQGLQRGGTCTIKALYADMRQCVSKNTAAHIKLRIRLDSSNLFLDSVSPFITHIPMLEWAKIKINLSLSKLGDNSTQEERLEVLELSQKIEKRIADLQLFTSILGKISLLETNITYPKPEVQILRSKETPREVPDRMLIKTSVHLSPAESLDQSIELANFIRDNDLRQRKKVDELERVAREYLEALPSCMSDLWSKGSGSSGKPGLSIEQIAAIFTICSHLLQYLPNEIYNHKDLILFKKRISSKHIALVTNALTGILISLRSSQGISKEYIAYKATTLLTYLKKALPQMRIVDFQTRRKLAEAIKMLVDLDSNRIGERSMTAETRFILKEIGNAFALTNIIEFPNPKSLTNYALVPEMMMLLKRPNVKENIKNWAKSSSGKIMLAGEGIDVNKLTDAQQALVAISNGQEPGFFPEPLNDLAKVLVKICDPILCIMQNPCLSGDVDKFDEYTKNNNIYRKTLIANAAEPHDKLETRVLTFPLYNPEIIDPSFGFGILNIYQWRDWLIAAQILDRRMKVFETIKHWSSDFPKLRNENAPGKLRETQNQQIQAVSNGIKFEGQDLPPEEFQELLGITSYDETLIPLTVNYFNKHFSRLKLPAFQSLFEALLWTNKADGSGPILAQALLDPDTFEADMLIDFLITSTSKLNDSSQALTLFRITRILAQMYANIRESTSNNFEKPYIKERYKKIEKALIESVSKLANTQGLQEGLATKVNYGLVSLYCYVREHSTLRDICSKANEALKKIYYYEHQSESSMIIEDYERGKIAFSTSYTNRKDRLPEWVFQDSNYVFTDRNPKLDKVDSTTYEFRDEGIPSKIVLSGHSSFKAYKQFKKRDGTTGWFCLETNAVKVGWYSNPFSHNGFLKNITSQWVSDDNQSPEAIITPLRIHTPKYRVLFEKGKKGLVQNCAHTDWFLSGVYDDPPPLIKRIFAMDRPENVLIWSNADDEIQQIEFHHYEGLTFTRVLKKLSGDSDETVCWESSLHKGYYIDPKFCVEELEPFSHYLVLVNEDGDRRVIMGQHQVESDFDKALSAPKPRIKIDQSPQLISYKLDVTQGLGSMLTINPHRASEEPYKILYRIHLALSKKEYRLAETLVNELALHPKEWTDKDLEMTQPNWLMASTEIGMIKDNHPFACAIRLRIYLIQYRSTRNKKFDVSEMMSDYLQCLNHSNTLGLQLNKEGDTQSEWLSRKDEELCLKLINSSWESISRSNPPISQPNRSILNNRQEQLNYRGTSRNLSQGEIPALISPIVSKPDWLADKELQKKMREAVDNPKPVFFYSRPGEAFVYNFLHYYRIAESQKNSPKFLELMELLTLTNNLQDSNLQYLRCILLFKAHGLTSVGTTKLPSFENLMKASNINRLLHEFSLKELRESRNGGFKGLDPSSIFEEALNIGFSKKISKMTQSTNLIPNNPVKVIRDMRTLKGFSPLKPRKLEDNPDIEFIKDELDIVTNAERIEILKTKINDLIGIHRVFSHDLVKNTSRKRLDGIDSEIQKLRKEQEQLTSGESVDPTYTLPSSKAKLGQLQEMLRGSIGKNQIRLEAMNKSILKAARPDPKDIQVRGGLIKPIDFKELLVAFGKQDDARILQANPYLTTEDLAKLKELIADYLVEYTQQQLYLRAQKQLDEAIAIAQKEEGGWQSIKAQIAANQVVSTLTTKRSYTGAEAILPALLVFESLFDMRLRENQTQLLLDLTGAKSKLDIELEAGTGFGKSKVFIPLWLFLTTKYRNRLTMMTVPTALYQDQIDNLRKLLGNAFHTGVQTIDFSRESMSDIDFLKNTLLQIEEAEIEHRILLIHIKGSHTGSRLALMQSLLESTPGLPSKQAKELFKLRKIMHNKLSSFIDESRECLDVRQRFDYAVGRLTYLESSYIELIDAFFEKVLLNTDILNKWNFEFLTGHLSPEKTNITSENYAQLQDELAKKALIFLKMPEVFKKHLTGELDPTAESLLKDLSPRQLKKYSFCRRQICEILPQTLLKRHGESYALSTRGVAFPCRKGEPRPTSEFSKSDIQIDLTIQGNLKCQIQKSKIEAFINILQDQAFDGIDISQKPSYTFLKSIMKIANLPQKLSQYTTEEVQKLQDFLNNPENILYKLRFVSLQVLPHISNYPKKISGSCFNLISSLHHVQAASATPNQLIKRLKPIEDPMAPIDSLLSLYKHSGVVVMDSISSVNILDTLLKDSSHRVIVDAGGLLRDLAQIEVVEKMLIASEKWENPAIKGVAYYDDLGCQMVLPRFASKPIPREQCSLPVDEIMIYIRQSKSVGADLSMPPAAKAYVTINSDTTENEFLQGCGRMRGLKTGQSVDIVITRHEANLIKETLKAEDLVSIIDIMRYVKIQDQLQKGKDYFCSLGLYLEDLFEAEIWKLAGDDLEKLSYYFHALQDVILKSTSTEPLEGLYNASKSIHRNEAIKQLKHTIIDGFKNVIKKSPFPISIDLEKLDLEKLEQDFNAYVEVERLPETLMIADREVVESTVETEQEQEIAKEVANEIEQEQLTEEQSEVAFVDFEPAKAISWDGDYIKAFTSSEKIYESQHLSVYVSPNYFRLDETLDIRDKARKRADHFVLRVGKDGATALLALDLYDMTRVFNKMKHKRPDRAQIAHKDFNYYLISAQNIIASDAAEKALKVYEVLDSALHPAAQVIMVIVKILGGYKTLTQDELTWIKDLSHKNPKEFSKLSMLLDEYYSVWPSIKPLVEQIKKAKHYSDKSRPRGLGTRRPSKRLIVPSKQTDHQTIHSFYVQTPTQTVAQEIPSDNSLQQRIDEFQAKMKNAQRDITREFDNILEYSTNREIYNYVQKNILVVNEHFNRASTIAIDSSTLINPKDNFLRIQQELRRIFSLLITNQELNSHLEAFSEILTLSTDIKEKAKEKIKQEVPKLKGNIKKEISKLLDLTNEFIK